MKLATLLLFAVASVVSAQSDWRIAVPEATTGNVTMSAKWLYLNQIDLDTLRFAIETKNSATDGYRITFLLKTDHGSAVITKSVVRNKEISYPSGQVYPFPAILDIHDLPSFAQITNLVIEELQFLPVSSGSFTSTQ